LAISDERKKCPGLGGEKLWHKYCLYYRKAYSLGRDAFITVLYNHGLTLRKKKRRCRTTDSCHPYPLYPNRIKGLTVTYFGQVIVSDITYIRQGDDFCFLSIVTDVYSRSIIGYYVGDTLEAKHTIMALNIALENLGDIPDKKGCIHHSDRGVQYASYDYTDILKEHKIMISIAVDYYNHERPHRSLNMDTPAQKRQKVFIHMSAGEIIDQIMMFFKSKPYI
jgi:transposase InsO family protein